MSSWLRAAAMLVVASACVPRQVVPPRSFPARPAEPADFSRTSLYLRSFTVEGAGEKDPYHATETLRRSFVHTLGQLNRFRAIVDLQDTPQPIAAPALLVDANVEIGHTTYRTWVLDLPFFVPLSGYWPLTPRWGDARVNLHLTALDAEGETLWSTNRSSEVDYWLVFYSWYRTRPVEEAYMAAYAEAFERVALDLGEARDELVVAAAEASPPPPAPRATVPRPSDQAIKIAVVPTQIDAAIAGEVPGLFDDYLLSAVQNAGNFQVIGQADIAAMLGFEREKDLLGCDDAACMADIGGALGVDLLVQVQVAKVEQEWVVTAKLINIREARVDARASDFIGGGVKALLQHVPVVIGKLFGG